MKAPCSSTSCETPAAETTEGIGGATSTDGPAAETTEGIGGATSSDGPAAETTEDIGGPTRSDEPAAETTEGAGGGTSSDGPLGAARRPHAVDFSDEAVIRLNETREEFTYEVAKLSRTLAQRRNLDQISASHVSEARATLVTQPPNVTSRVIEIVIPAIFGAAISSIIALAVQPVVPVGALVVVAVIVASSALVIGIQIGLQLRRR